MPLRPARLVPRWQPLFILDNHGLSALLNYQDVGPSLIALECALVFTVNVPAWGHVAQQGGDAAVKLVFSDGHVIST